MMLRSLAGMLPGACLLLAAGSAARANDAETVVLEPIGPWQLDMAEHKCRIARVFGSEDKRNVFYLEQWSPSAHANWIVAGPAVEGFRSSRKLDYSFGPGGHADSVDFTETTLGEFGNVVGADTSVAAHEHPEGYEDDEIDYRAHPHGLPLLDSKASASITALTVSQNKGRKSVTLNLGPMGKPLSAMNTCMIDLVGSWGFEVDEQKKVVFPAKIENLEKVAGLIQRFYPSDALRKGAQADFSLRLTVDETGAIDKCVLVNQTLAEDFDMSRHPCTIFAKYAEAEPARTADGTAVPSYYVSRIIYRMWNG